MKAHRYLVGVFAICGATACSATDDLERSSACVAYLQIRYRADPSSDRNAIPAAILKAYNRSQELSRKQTGDDRRSKEIAGRTVRELAERFGTGRGPDSPELVSFLRQRTSECLTAYGNS